MLEILDCNISQFFEFCWNTNKIVTHVFNFVYSVFEF